MVRQELKPDCVCSLFAALKGRSSTKWGSEYLGSYAPTVA